MKPDTSGIATDRGDAETSSAGTLDGPSWMRPRTVEIFLVIQLIIAWMCFSHFEVDGFIDGIARTLLNELILSPLFVVGFGLRYAIARFRRRPEDVPGKDFWLDLPRLMVAYAIAIHVYAWLKVTVPILNPANFDRELWALDQFVGLGFQPNVFFLQLLSHPAFLHLIDWSYSGLFIASLVALNVWFLTDPRRERRWTMATGMTLLWVSGAYIYVLVPALGPVYRFPDIYAPVAEMMPTAVLAQRMLLGNYMRVMEIASGGQSLPVMTEFGVAAFPSLHVGHVAFLYLWIRKTNRPLVLPFLIGLVLMFIGSIVTGWHYMIDSIAGLLLAWIAFRVALAVSRMETGQRLFAGDELMDDESEPGSENDGSSDST